MVALARSADEAFFEGLLWLGGVVLAAAGTVVVLVFIRARMRRMTRARESLFSLTELRRLRDSGELSITEYEALRGRVLEAHKDAPDADG